jgi:mutator protein MutT
MSENSQTLPHKKIGVAVIYNDQGQILIDRRLPDGLLGGFWEFPGGKIEPGETVEQCIQREIKEELGIEISVNEHLITVNHDYSNFRVTLTVHSCYYLEGKPQTLECAEIKWVTLDEIDQYSFPQANSIIINYLKMRQ